jgi:hypothetical protein
MLKTILKYFLLTSIFFFNVNFKKKALEIEWQNDRPLTWEDFKGEPDKESPYYALTYSGISLSSHYEGEALFVKVICTFSPNQSWVKKGKETADLLLHEQMHFNITEIHARKIRQAISKLDKTTPKKIIKKVDELFNLYFKESKEMQSKYDRETDHSVNTNEQIKWNKLIKTELDKLNAYAAD